VWIESEWKIIWEGGMTYTSQGERPSVNLVRQLLMSCGMSCTVHKIAPVVMGDKIIAMGGGTNEAGPMVLRMISANAFTGINYERRAERG
jgi:hypothetical protein